MFLVRIIVLVLLVVLGYRVVRTGLFAMSAYNEASQLKKIVSNDVNASDLSAMQPHVESIARSVRAMDREVRLFKPLFQATAILPRIGPTIAALPTLLSAGSDYAVIGNESLQLMTELQAEYPDYNLTQLALAAVERYPDTFVAMGAYAQDAAGKLQKLNADAMLPKAIEPVHQLQAISGLTEAGLEISPDLAEALGYYGPRTYLLLVQNNHELRATGGFISAVGVVTLDKGKPGAIDLTDSYNVRRDDVDHPWAPDPMRDYMGVDLIFIRDANWSPDFPTTGQLAQTLYEQDAGVRVDGVVSVDLRAVELLVDALAPLKVEGSDVPITGDNLIEQIKKFWDTPIETGDTIDSAGMQEWWKQRKDFMPALAAAAIDRIQDGNYSPLKVAAAGKQALDERAIQVWLSDDGMQTVLAENGWDGGMQPRPDADLLGLVDTNMGYNKVDSVLDRSLSYAVSWPNGEEKPAIAEATIDYRHPIEAPGHECDQRPRYGDNYDAMTVRCYFDYVRLYAPAGSELMATSGLELDSVGAGFGENGATVFSGYFEMQPGTEHQVTFQYRLPDWITPDNYELMIRRQSGSGPLPVTAQVGREKLSTVVETGQFVWNPAKD